MSTCSAHSNVIENEGISDEVSKGCCFQLIETEKLLLPVINADNEIIEEHVKLIIRQYKSLSTKEKWAIDLRFYKEKTLERLDLFRKKYPGPEKNTCINGYDIPPIPDLLPQIPWDRLAEGVPCFMHGDLQFDNIIYDSESNLFKLLDWRQDFAGHIEFGDIYYDLAKLCGGLILNYDLIKLNLFDYHEDSKSISFDFAQRYQSTRYVDILEEFLQSHNYNTSKVKILVGLIYLNMSPLHHPPFDKMLFHLGKSVLAKELNFIK